jgi:hypothetical protein
MGCRNPWSRVGPRPGRGHNCPLSGTGWSWIPSRNKSNDPNTWGECDAVTLGVEKASDLDKVTVLLCLVLNARLNDPNTWGECYAVGLGVK